MSPYQLPTARTSRQHRIPCGEDDSIDVTINVTDVNEKPVFDATPLVEMRSLRTLSADTTIGAALTATDPENDALTYTLDSGSAATFEIDSNGQLKTKADLNYEADPAIPSSSRSPTARTTTASLNSRQ